MADDSWNNGAKYECRFTLSLIFHTFWDLLNHKMLNMKNNWVPQKKHDQVTVTIIIILINPKQLEMYIDTVNKNDWVILYKCMTVFL